jgi:cellulose synthase/poly-beta-1,6-N-acetylglucosamine synthase-like glycosyltransferase
MDSILTAALWALTGCLSFLAVYLAFITLGSWLYRPAIGSGGRESRLAVLVPAHNESTGIIPTLRDLGACEYPARLRDIFVIADNCTDDTAAVARACGAQVFERTDTTLRGKGQALDWFLTGNRDLLSRHDVIAIVDADMYVDSQFLAALDDAFAIQHTLVVQGKYLASNPAESWISAFGFLGFAVANHVRPAGRCFLRSSAGLKGSGMAFRKELLLGLGWPCKSVAEDLEFGKELALQDIRIRYVPQASVSSRLGTSAQQAYVQQARWEGGRTAVSLKYLRLLSGRFLRTPHWQLAEEILDLLVPPLSVLAAGCIVGVATSVVMGSSALLPLLCCTGVFVTLVVTGVIQSRMPLRAVGYLAGLPIFMTMKLALLVKTALGGSDTWRRTPRSKDP